MSPEALAAAGSFFTVSELVITIIFTLEALLKITAYGLLGYFSVNWNVLDFLVIVISWAGIALEDVSQFNFLRALRSVRMLKLASLHEGMRVVIISLYHSLPAVFNVMLVLLIFLLIFGILGMQLNAGRWNFCDVDLDMGDPYATPKRSFTVGSKHECLTVYNGTWMTPMYGNFDTIFNAVLVLFETATLEMWPDFMTYMSDAAWDLNRVTDVPPTPAPEPYWPIHVIIFWVVWIFIASFIIMNLFIGVVVETFQRNKERSEGTIFLTERQQKWVLVMSVVITKRAQRVPVPPKSTWRKHIFYLVTSPAFELFIVSTIVLSVVAMATNVYDAAKSPAHAEILNSLNLCFCVVFTVECVLKLFGLSIVRYFRDPWNVFDFVLVVFSIVDLVLEKTNTGGDAVDPVYFRCFRLIRIGRLFRLVRGFKAMLRMIHTLYTSLPALVNVLGLMLLLLVIYAIAGVSLFADKRPQYAAFLDWFDGGSVGFQNFGMAMLTLLRCVTGESWNGIMHDLMISEDANPYQCSVEIQGSESGSGGEGSGVAETETAVITASPCLQSGLFSGIYFVTFTIFATFMLLNLLIGVILQNFSNTLSSGTIKCISPEQIDDFARAWRMFDMKGTNQIEETKLPLLLHSLRAHGWVYGHGGADLPVTMGENVLLARKLAIPAKRGNINFANTLQALSRAIHHSFEKERIDELNDLESANWDQPIDSQQLETVARSSHEEVSRARSRMRNELMRMRHRSLVTTGMIKKPVMASYRRTRHSAARVVQRYAKAMLMRHALDKLVKDGALGGFSIAAYVTAIEFIIYTQALVKAQHFEGAVGFLDRVGKHVASRAQIVIKAADDESSELSSDILNDMGLQKAYNSMCFNSRSKKPPRRPPMTTSYATMLIQRAWRTKCEQRRFNGGRMFAKKLQAHWRASQAQRAASHALRDDRQPSREPGLAPSPHMASCKAAPPSATPPELNSATRSAHGVCTGGMNGRTHHELTLTPTSSDQSDELPPVLPVGAVGGVDELPFSANVYPRQFDDRV